MLMAMTMPILDLSQPAFTLSEYLFLTLFTYLCAHAFHGYRVSRAQARAADVLDWLKRMDARLDGVVERLDLDPLTGTYSRSAGERRMHEALRVFPAVIIWIDIDDFGVINKTQGWDAGDRILRALATGCLSRFRRAHDTVFRYGDKADEFCIVLPVFGERNQDGDPVFIMREWAERQMQEIQDSIACTFTMGISSTTQIDGERPIAAVTDAQDQVRALKARRDLLRAAHDGVPAPAEEEEPRIAGEE